MKNPSYKAQVVLDNAKSWPYIGNAYANKDGSLSLLLDRGVKLVLADGTTFEATDKSRVKVFLRAPRGQGASDAAQPVKEPAAPMSGVHVFA